jgi:hypothetical protein
MRERDSKVISYAYVYFYQNRESRLKTIGLAYTYTMESQKFSALLFFQFIYTKVGVEQVRHFST